MTFFKLTTSANLKSLYQLGARVNESSKGYQHGKLVSWEAAFQDNFAYAESTV